MPYEIELRREREGADIYREIEAYLVFGLYPEVLGLGSAAEKKAFIIKRIGTFSGNLRSEISKSAKYYFCDVGVRNAVINDFRPIQLRNDVGALWKNFVVMELLKKYEYEHRYANFYFWRTYDQKELDLVIEGNGALSGYEIKWRDSPAKVPKLWLDTYKSEVRVITKEALPAVLEPSTLPG